MNIDTINWHGTQVHRIVESIESSTLTFEVDYPSGDLDDKYSPARIVFEDVATCRIQEGACAPPLVILDASLCGAEFGRSIVRLETGWGYRDIECKNVRVEKP